jgi:cellobiose-specific phosphotransferase system component IIA
MSADSNLDRLMAQYQQGDFDAAAALIAQLSPQLRQAHSWRGRYV